MFRPFGVLNSKTCMSFSCTFLIGTFCFFPCVSFQSCRCSLELELSSPLNQDVPSMLKYMLPSSQSTGKFISQHFESVVTSCTTCLSCNRISRYTAPGQKCISLNVSSTLERLSSESLQTPHRPKSPRYHLCSNTYCFFNHVAISSPAVSSASRAGKRTRLDLEP